MLYLILAVTTFNSSNEESKCIDIELSIKDSIHGGFISKNEIHSILKAKNLYPVDKVLANISTNEIEKELHKHPLIDQVECFKTPSRKIGIEIHQRIPIVRVLSNKGGFFVDNKREIMPSQTKCTADLIAITGNVSKDYAKGDLYDFAVFISKDSFWNNQIEQIHVIREDLVEIVPRVGDHIVTIGNLDDYESKLQRLKIFYEKVLTQVGWNKYKMINVEFSNQIICTKVN